MAKKKDSSSPFITGMLAFNRSFEITEALMFGSVWSDPKMERRPVLVERVGVRGQTSNATTKKETHNQGKSNIQMIDRAILPSGYDALDIDFTVTVVPASLKPSATDDHAVSTAFRAFSGQFQENGGYKDLAVRYVGNIAAGRFAWRNRFVAVEAAVSISVGGDTISFDALRLPHDAVVDRDTLLGALTSGDAAMLDRIFDAVEHGLTVAPRALAVRWRSHMSPLATVYPSQEYLGSDTKEEGKVLASVPNFNGAKGERHASIHSQKIGAALRAIDDWYVDETGLRAMHGAIPVNPFGGVQDLQIAMRGSVGSKSLYQIMSAPEGVMDDLAAGVVSDDARFFAANLIRGGVFGFGDA